MKERENYYERHGIKTSETIAMIAFCGLGIMFMIGFITWLIQMVA